MRAVLHDVEHDVFVMDREIERAEDQLRDDAIEEWYWHKGLPTRKRLEHWVEVQKTKRAVLSSWVAETASRDGGVS